jgi:hypothetical protein
MIVEDPEEGNLLGGENCEGVDSNPLEEELQKIYMHLKAILSYSDLNALPEDHERIRAAIKFHENSIRTIIEDSFYPSFIFNQFIQFVKDVKFKLKERNKNV